MGTAPVKIIIENATWSRVEGLDENTLDNLIDRMQVTDQKRFFMAKRTGGKMSRYVRFMSEKGQFLTGLVPNVEAMLDEMGLRHKLYRLKSCPPPVEIDESLLTPMLVRPRGQSLRSDQIQFLQAAIDNRRGGVHAATAYGKTAVLAAWLKLVPEETLTIVLINSVDLIKQTYTELINLGVNPDILGRFTGKHKEANWITLTTVNSLPNLKEILPNVRRLAADEAHYKITSPSSVPYLRKMINAHDRIWFSATPFKRKDKVHNWKLLGHFGPVLGTAKAKDLQEKGILSKCKFIFHMVNVPDGNSSEYEDMDYREAYDELIVHNRQWHQLVAALIKSMKGRTVVFVERIAHGEQLVEQVDGMIWASGKDNENYRAEVIKKLQISPVDTPVASTRIFKTGVDVFVHNVVNCSAMSSEIGTLQGAGRGFRLAPDKDGAEYHDFIFPMNPHLLRHSKDRIRDLKREGHEIEIVDDLFEIYDAVNEKSKNPIRP